jgi:hypothetical protein
LQNSSNKNEIDFSNDPAILACWNSEEVQREFAAWQAEQAHHATSKEKQSVPDGERPVVHISVVCGFFRVRLDGHTLFLFHHGWVYVKTHHRNSL